MKSLIVIRWSEYSSQLKSQTNEEHFHCRPALRGSTGETAEAKGAVREGSREAGGPADEVEGAERTPEGPGE